MTVDKPEIALIDANTGSSAEEHGLMVSHALARSGVAVVSFGGEADAEESLLSLTPWLGRIQAHKHVRSAGFVTIDTNAYTDGVRRPQNSPSTQSPHNDGCFLENPPRVVALFCNSPARVGGESTLVSGAAILSGLLDEFRPGEIAPLFSDHAYSIWRGDKKLSRAALTERTDEAGNPRVGCYFGSHEFNRVYPSVTARPAFDFIRGFVRDPAHQVQVSLKAGDCLIFENSSVLHGRTGWTNSEAQRRVCTRGWYEGGEIETDFVLHDPNALREVRAELADSYH